MIGGELTVLLFQFTNPASMEINGPITAAAVGGAGLFATLAQAGLELLAQAAKAEKCPAHEGAANILPDSGAWAFMAGLASATATIIVLVAAFCLGGSVVYHWPRLAQRVQTEPCPEDQTAHHAQPVHAAAATSSLAERTELDDWAALEEQIRRGGDTAIRAAAAELDTDPESVAEWAVQWRTVAGGPRITGGTQTSTCGNRGRGRGRGQGRGR